MKKKKFNKKLKLKKISVANLNEIKGEANNDFINRSFGYCGSDIICYPSQQSCDYYCFPDETFRICH